MNAAEQVLDFLGMVRESSHPRGVAVDVAIRRLEAIVWAMAAERGPKVANQVSFARSLLILDAMPGPVTTKAMGYEFAPEADYGTMVSIGSQHLHRLSRAGFARPEAVSVWSITRAGREAAAKLRADARRKGTSRPSAPRVRRAVGEGRALHGA